MINICFHGIGEPQRTLEPNEEHYWIGADLYLQIIDEVAERPEVALSFDDGNVSDLEIGLEPLLRTGQTATFFVIAARLDQPGSLSRKNLCELRDHGMRIGTHGMNHVPWRRLGHQEREAEFVEARAVISEAVGLPVDEAALPLGRYDRSTLRELRRLEYTTVFTSDRAHTRPGRWLQPRFSVHADDTIESVRAILQPQPLRTVVTVKGKELIKRLR